MPILLTDSRQELIYWVHERGAHWDIALKAYLALGWITSPWMKTRKELPFWSFLPDSEAREGQR